MKTTEQWFQEYAVSHQNRTNQLIHKFAVPGIYFSIVGILWCIPPLTLFGFQLNWVWLAMPPVLFFYWQLSRVIFIVMSCFTLACIALIFLLSQSGIAPFPLSISLFVILWVLQFIGHKIEGKKPSFFQDIQFLLIGPAWVFAFFLSFLPVPHSK